MTVPEGNAAPETIPTILVSQAPPVPAAPCKAAANSPWRIRVFLLAPSLLAVGIPVCTGGGFAGLGLAAGLVLACILVGLWSRWRPAVRFLLTLVLMALGYGVAFAVLVPEVSEPPPRPTSPMDSMGRFSMMPRMGQFVFPAASPTKPPPKAPAIDLQFHEHIGDLLAVAVDPPSGVAFVSRADGSLDRYSYPDFREQRRYRLSQPCYRLALDGRRGRLYAAASEPGALRVNRYGERPVGRGDLHVYDVSALLRGALAKTSLSPAAVVPLGGDVDRLLLAPDGDCLYYLVHRPDGDTVGRVPADLGGEVRLRPEGGATALALPPDGKTLYAAGPGMVHVLEPRTLGVRRRLPVPLLPADLASDNAGRLFLTEAGQWTTITVLDCREGDILSHWNPKMHGRLYVGLTPDGARLYLGTSSLVSNSLRGWIVRGTVGPTTPAQVGQTSSDPNGPVRGEFFITPDCRHLINRWGKVFRLAPPPQDVPLPPAPRRA